MPVRNGPTRFRTMRKASARHHRLQRTPAGPPQRGAGLQHRIAELEKENLDLKITNRAKDLFIEQLREDRREMATERKDLISRVMHWALGGPDKVPLHLEA